MLESEECLDIETDGETVSLSPSSFWALFTLTAGTSTITLLFYSIHKIYSNSDQNIFWRLMLMIIQQWGCAKRQMSRKVSDVAESSMNTPNTHAMLNPV